MKKEDLVKEGYNKIAHKYTDTRTDCNLPELKYLISLLPENAKILDVGCGSGIPVTRFFVENGCSVTGVDISEEMLELAKQNVPKAEFFQYDMNDLDFPENSFNCITAVYSLFHVPKEKHQTILEIFFQMLKPNGILFFCVGSKGGDWTDECLGSEMFWSNYPPEKTLSLVKEAGFKILFDEVLDRGDELQYWVFARKE